jgi:altronate hydrolase
MFHIAAYYNYLIQSYGRCFMRPNAILVHPDDNVAVVTEKLKSGTTVVGVDVPEITVVSDVPKNHKVAIKEVKEGESIIKYGASIGTSSKDIPVGDWVHTHNLKAEGK